MATFQLTWEPGGYLHAPFDTWGPYVSVNQILQAVSFVTTNPLAGNDYYTTSIGSQIQYGDGMFFSVAPWVISNGQVIGIRTDGGGVNFSLGVSAGRYEIQPADYTALMAHGGSVNLGGAYAPLPAQPLFNNLPEGPTLLDKILGPVAIGVIGVAAGGAILTGAGVIGGGGAAAGGGANAAGQAGLAAVSGSGQGGVGIAAVGSPGASAASFLPVSAGSALPTTSLLPALASGAAAGGATPAILAPSLAGIAPATVPTSSGSLV